MSYLKKTPMKDYTPFEIAELILARKNNSISEEEERNLNDWKNSSERNEQLYNRLLDENINTDAVERKFEEYDYDKYYKECCNKIDKSRRTRFVEILKWAALIAIPITVFSLFYFRDSQTQVYQAMSDIRPGTSSAVLILSDGEKVTLGDKNAGDQIVKDNIKVESDTLKYESVITEKIAYNTIIIPRGGEFVLKLSDGTKIWLNAESELKYPVSFTGKERRVYLKGEAFFDVTKNEKSPFKVVTNDHVISVLGTEFSIRAYSDEKYITTTLESGKVSIDAGNRHAELLPGQQSNVSNSEMTVKDVNTQLYTAWHNNKFVFENQSLREILHTLSRWYDMEVNYDVADLGEIRFTGELMKYTNVVDFLEKLEALEKVRFDINGKNVVVTAY